MADGKIEIDTGINTSGAEQGLEKLKKTIKGIGDGSLVKGIANVGLAFGGITGVVKGVSTTVKAAKAAIDDLTATYKVQAQAETQLAAAARNNPYLLSENVKHLKDYASELQSISTYGDEELLPFMAQLASAGRTEQEIMDIMSASINVASSGSMSLESAVKNLNKTFSGLSGELGEVNPQVKALSAEQLKNGDAVKVLAKQYAGMAQEVAKATGSSQQLHNAIGDLKEEMGAPFEKAMSPLRVFFTTLISGWADAKRAKREYNEAEEAAEAGTQTSSQEELLIKKEESELQRLESQFNQYQVLIDGYTGSLKTSTKAFLNAYNEYQMAVGDVTPEEFIEKGLKPYIKAIDEQKAKVQGLREEYENLKKAEEEAAKKEQQEEESNRIAAERAAAAKEEAEARDKLRGQYDETLRQKQEEINQRRVTGETISEEAEAQEMYNTAVAAYIKMMSDPAFKGNSGNYAHEVNARNQIGSWGEIAGKEDLKKQLESFRSELKEADDEVNGYVQNQYDALLETLDLEYSAVIDNKYLEEEEKLRIEKEYADMREKIIKAKNDEEQKAIEEKLNALTADNQTYWDKYITKKQEIADLEKEIAADADKQREELQEKYKDDESALSEAIIELDKTTAERMREIDEAYAKNRADMFANLMNDVANYTAQTVDIVNNAANLMLETSKNNAKAEQAALEEKYLKGEISEEEYQEKITESKKKAAKEQYKIQMVQWAASILQATANIAQGVTQAIAQGGVAGLITGGLVAAAGAVQIASIIASKPTPPNFAGGGFIGGMNGATMGSDNTYVHARTGEMVANAAQQRNLWEAMNGNGGGSGTNIVINNSASNIATAQPKITRNQIEIMIDARVNDGLKNGRYDKSLTQAESGMGGDYYGI